MKCPKCSRTMFREEGGYSRANVTSGFGFQLPESYSCSNCGKYIEVYPKKEVPFEFKSTSPKTEGEIGFLKQFVRSHYSELLNLRNKGASWKKVQLAIEKIHPDATNLNWNSLGAAFREELRDRRQHA